MSKKFVVFLCENRKSWKEENFSEMFIKHLYKDGDSWETLYLDLDKITNIDNKYLEYDGIVITGSSDNCRDNLEWMVAINDFLIKAINYKQDNGKLRIYGGCFGAQIIAQSLGGKVDKNNHKNEFILGAERISISNNLKENNINNNENNLLPSGIYKYMNPKLINLLHSKHLNNNEKEFRLLLSHGDSVHILPSKSILLASSPRCQNEIFITYSNKDYEKHTHNIESLYNITPRFLAFQSHPEFDLKFAIIDRILKNLKFNNRITLEEEEVALNSFNEYDPNHAKLTLEFISNFLHNTPYEN